MQKNKHSQYSKEVMYEFFLADLLDGNITGRYVIYERLKCLKWILHEKIYVLTIRKKHIDMVDDSFLADLSHSISDHIYGSKPIVYNNSIVLIINRKKKFPNQKEMTYLSEFLKKNEMYGGISRCFHAMEDIVRYFKQSVKASGGWWFGWLRGRFITLS